MAELEYLVCDCVELSKLLDHDLKDWVLDALIEERHKGYYGVCVVNEGLYVVVVPDARVAELHRHVFVQIAQITV